MYLNKLIKLPLDNKLFRYNKIKFLKDAVNFLGVYYYQRIRILLKGSFFDYYMK